MLCLTVLIHLVSCLLCNEVFVTVESSDMMVQQITSKSGHRNKGIIMDQN